MHLEASVFAKIFWGGMPPDPPSLGRLRGEVGFAHTWNPSFTNPKSATAPLKVIDPSAAGVPTDNFKETQFHDLSTEKFENMKLRTTQLYLAYNLPT